MEITQKSVEDWLNTVSYAPDDSYSPSEFALDFIIFIKLVNGAEGEEHKTPVVHYRMLDKVAGDNKKIINMCSRGLAKALPLDTVLFTDTGKTTIADVKVGDFIIGEDGKRTKVTAKSEVFHKPMYEILLKDGRQLIVSEDHINTVIHKRKVRYGGRKGKCVTEYQRRNLSTKELLQYAITTDRKKTLKNPKGFECNFWIPTNQSIQYSEKTLPIDPYTLGAILGDGSIDSNTGYVRLHGHIDDFDTYLNKIPYEFGSIYIDKRNTSVRTQGIKKLGKITKMLGINVHGDNKFIPTEYFCGSHNQRLELLRGLMDTDGTCYTNGGIAFSSNSLALAKGVVDLVRSLGGIANCTPMDNSYRVNIRINERVFHLPRKANRQLFKSQNKVGIVSITPIPDIEDIPSQCIAVDNATHTYLAGDYIVTHNTTVLGEYLFLYIAVYGEIPGFGKIDLAIYVSDSIENGVKNMRKNLEFRWENSEFLKKYIPYTRFTDIRWEFKNIDGSTLIVKSYGGKTGVRGAKEMGKRPQLAVLDDLVSDEDARSTTIIESIESTVNKAVNFALHPTRSKTIWSGTPFNSRDPLYKAVESGAWHVSVFPVCEEFPCRKEDFRGAWPDRFNYEYVLEQYEFAKKQGRVADFNQELMLRIMSDDDRVILDSDIVWYKRNNVLHNKGMFNFYITTDFATSKETSADFSTIFVWAYNANGDWLWVDGICKRQTMNDNINDLFRLAQIYRPQSVGIEVTGQQGGFIPWIQEQMMVRNNYFTLASDHNSNKPGIRPNTNKMVRFMVMEPMFKLKKMWFPEEMQDDPVIMEIMLELSLISPAGMKSKHDDCIDPISMLPSMKAWKPSADSPKPDDVENSLWSDDSGSTSNSLDSYII